MQTQTRLQTSFGWKPMIKSPEASFLQGEDGEAFVEEYNGRADKDYKGTQALKVLSYDKDAKTVKGSNPLAVVLVNQILRPEGIRTATPADLELMLKNGWDFEGTYEDSALVLRSEDSPNEYLAKNLAEQIKVRQKLKFPVMIPLAGLQIVQDRMSNYGLAFKLTDESEIIYAPILNKDGRFNSEDINLKTGLPKQLREDGERGNYTINSGLSGLFLGRYSALDSRDCDGLAYSNDDGRVVLKSGEAAAKIS